MNIQSLKKNKKVFGWLSVLIVVLIIAMVMVGCSPDIITNKSDTKNISSIDESKIDGTMGSGYKQYRLQGFEDNYTNSKRGVPASGPTVEGIDVSVYQGTINWTSVKNAGKYFAFARVSNGTSIIDSTFNQNWNGMKSAGVYRGAYQFFRPGQDVTAQANLMLSKIGTMANGDLPPVIDVEVTDGVSGSVIVERVKTWVSIVRVATGRNPIIYTFPSFWSSLPNTSTITGADLWIAHWDTTSPTVSSPWSTWNFHQYSDSGSVSGISGAVDLDRYNGSLASLASYASLPVINPPYLFPNDVQGWTKGNSATDPWWYNVGWPGILITDQTGLDAFIYSPKTNFTARNFPQVVNIDFYPQNGTTSNHEMKMYWKTDDQNNWDESKSSPMKTYTAKDKWLSLNINVDNPLFKTHVVNQLRLDFDHSVNSQTRYIVNHVILQDQIVYSFSSNIQGWTAGHSVTNPWWYNVGWPGILITDQTGTDAFIYSPVLTGDGYPYNYLGASNDKVHVRIYPQNGTTANHEMKIYWITETDTTWDEAKSTSVNYIGQNTWVDVILPVGQNPKWSDRSPHIKQLRLDFDQANTQTRYIVDYIKTEY